MAVSTGKRIGQWIAVVLVIAVLAGGAVAYLNRTEIRDYFVASTFQPSNRISEVQQEIALTPRGDRVFLASEPTIGGREEFSKWCEKVEHTEQGHVLGCFADRRIRLFEVTDTRLEGVVQVTAAHELLHAAWARMGDDERNRVTEMLTAEYDSRAAADPAFKERMSVYENLSKSAFANELHSVFGTEVAELPEELETHYKEWLTDRAQIVRWYDAYHSVFTELSDEAAKLTTELEALRTDIEARSTAYDNDVKKFNSDAAEFKARNELYEFSGKQELFESIRQGLLTRQQSLESTLEGIQADTDRFNTMRERLVELNEISTELNDVLNSAPSAPSGPTATPNTHNT